MILTSLLHVSSATLSLLLISVQNPARNIQSGVGGHCGYPCIKPADTVQVSLAYSL